MNERVIVKKIVEENVWEIDKKISDEKNRDQLKLKIEGSMKKSEKYQSLTVEEMSEKYRGLAQEEKLKQIKTLEEMYPELSEKYPGLAQRVLELRR